MTKLLCFLYYIAIIHMTVLNVATSYSWMAKYCRSNRAAATMQFLSCSPPTVSSLLPTCTTVGTRMRNSSTNTSTRRCKSKLDIYPPSRDNDDEEKDEINVSFETASNQKTLKVQKGENLRSAMLKRGISLHNGRSRLINCRGLGTCGTCAVEITCANDVNGGAGSAVVPIERNAMERLRLNFPPHGGKDQSSNLRLACQVQVNGDICVRKRTGFWGQDVDGLAEEYESQLWLGELEYVLDDKSPTSRPRRSPPSTPPQPQSSKDILK
mmetsp:Transcript_587/g.1050  ORF Transcript_587/g.1050 Transcript_587/m.1050 type:complete len:268 (+) Transcript_587:261-1064(+)